MKNTNLWKETLVIFKNNEFVINKNYISLKSLLVSKLSLPIYKKLITKYSRGVLLDLGCGTVPYYSIYKDQVDEVICIDWADSFHNNIHLDYIADLNSEIPLISDYVDTILLSEVLEHIYEPKVLMREISRVLKKNGKLILGVPFLYCLHEEPFDFHRYTKHALVNLCESNSMKVISLEVVGGPITVLCDIIAKNLPLRFSVFFQKIAFAFLNSKFGKNLNSRNADKFPTGYRLVAIKI